MAKKGTQENIETDAQKTDTEELTAVALPETSYRKTVVELSARSNEVSEEGNIP